MFRSWTIVSIAALGVALFAVFVAWIGVVRAGHAPMVGGPTPARRRGFRAVLARHTPRFTALVPATSVVSSPMPLDRDVDPAAVVRTSARAVLANPGPVAL